MSNLLITVHEGNANALAFNLSWNFLYGLNLITRDIECLCVFML